MKQELMQYMKYLEREEKSLNTRRQYQRDILSFLSYLDRGVLTKAFVIHYKEKLQREYQPSSVNTKLAAINGFFTFLGKNDLKVKQLKIQQKTFCSKKKELSKSDYLRLIEAAKQQKNEKLSLLIQTICSTGIRVSELRFITAEAVHCGESIIHLKGKTRIVLICGKLRKALKRFMLQQGIHTGPLFITKSGRPLDRSNIWKMMKALCKNANVEPSKVFPHNLRHLFARSFYALDKDIAKLADILGHSNINTTRIYTVSSGIEHRKRMDSLGLVI